MISSPHFHWLRTVFAALIRIEEPAKHFPSGWAVTLDAESLKPWACTEFFFAALLLQVFVADVLQEKAEQLAASLGDAASVASLDDINTGMHAGAISLHAVDRHMPEPFSGAFHGVSFRLRTHALALWALTSLFAHMRIRFSRSEAAAML